MSVKPRQSAMEQAWKPLLSQADKSRVRKAKQDARNKAVSRIRGGDGQITATVRASGPERGSFQVVIPWLADYTAHQSVVAKWLAARPDWLAAHFACEWEPSFKAFLNTNQIQVFPDESILEQMNWQTKCTCNDWQSLCAHALALLFHLLWEADEHPLYIFGFVGLDVDWLLDEAHKSASQLEQEEELKIDVDATHGFTNLFDVCESLRGIAPTEPMGRLVPVLIQK